MQWWRMQAECTNKERIQFSFSLFRDFGIPLREMCTLAVQSGAFRQEEYEVLKEKPDTTLVRENILKSIIRAGNQCCSAFLSELYRRGYKDLHGIISTSHELNWNEDESGDVYKYVTRDVLQQNFDSIFKNLNIVPVLDMLFEHGIITVNEHDSIQSIDTRMQKRRVVLEMLLQREDREWLSKFITILRLTGHDELLERLVNSVTQAQMPIGEIHIGRTILVSPVPPVDYIAVLSSNSTAGGQINLIEVADVNVIQESIDADVIEIWEGSIYFHLCTFTPCTIQTILKGEGDQTVINCLKRLFQSNRSLLLHFAKDQVIQFKLEEKTPEVFINKGYGKKSIGLNKTHCKDPCLDCYQATLRQNYRLVLEEIEDDIIKDTVNRVNDTRTENGSQYATTGCLLKNKTREDKAVTFFQYVLCNVDVLQAFRAAFSYRSQVVLKEVKCRRCSGQSDELVPLKPSKRVLYFTVGFDDFKGVQITNVTYTIQLPTVVFKNITADPEPGKPLRQTSMIELYSRKESFRVVVIGESKWRFQFLSAAKHLQDKLLRFFEMPNFLGTEGALEDEEIKKKVAHCIASVSPGPHAFIFITNLPEQLHLQRSLEPYLKFFGPDFLNFLVLVFTESKPKRITDEMVEKAVYLQSVLKQCGYRYLTFSTKESDNTTSADIQKLVRFVERMQSQNEKSYYNSELFEKSEKAVQRTAKIIEDETKSNIRFLQAELLHTRDKAAEELRSQPSFIEIIFRGN